MNDSFDGISIEVKDDSQFALFMAFSLLIPDFLNYLKSYDLLDSLKDDDYSFVFQPKFGKRLARLGVN